MSYYQYDPNFYYYDDCSDYEDLDEYPNVEYTIPPRRYRRVGKPIAKSVSDGYEMYQRKTPRYAVPVVYAPTRMPDLQKFNDIDDEEMQERLDMYYNDRRNFEREAMMFQNYTQPYYCVSTIQEETESTSTYVEAPVLKSDVAVGSDRSIALTDHANMTDIPVKLRECSQKVLKIRRKKNALNFETSYFKKCKRRDKSPKSGQALGKLESCNSWTTLPSSTYTANKEVKQSEPVKDSNQDVSLDLPVKHTEPCECLPTTSNASVKYQLKKNDKSSKNVAVTSHPELTVSKDTDKIPNDSKMTEDFRSTCNVNSFAEKTTKSAEMLGWRNKALTEDSSVSEISKISMEREIKSSEIVPLSSDTTDITINTEEYREFIKSINNPLRAETPVPSQTCATNAQTKVEKCVAKEDLKSELIKKVLGERSSSDSFIERFMRATQYVEEKPYYMKKVNPLVEVPLGISRDTMYYIPTFVMNDLSMMLKENGEQREVSKNRSVFLKLIRNMAELIAFVQNFAYKYFLRYILFV